MKNKEKNSKKKKDSPELSKNNSEKIVEVEIEKNLSIATKEHNRARLEKWKIGKRNFS